MATLITQSTIDILTAVRQAVPGILLSIMTLMRILLITCIVHEDGYGVDDDDNVEVIVRMYKASWLTS
jgi:hypothetical protein